MWDRIAHRLALLELVVTGRLRRRKSQEQAWDWLAELSWTRRTGRRDELEQADARALEPRRLLDQVWPDWEQVWREMGAAGLPASERGWSELQAMERSRLAMGLPPRLNRRTALAQVGVHSKSAMSRRVRERLAETRLTHDGMVRLRPSSGLRLRVADQEMEAAVVARMLGEVILTERALVAGTEFGGTLPRLLLTVENLGAYLDLRAPADCLVAHVPGWDTRTIRLIFERLPWVPVVHFGDLDPNGVRIVRHLHGLRPDLRWLVPPFWAEFIAERGLKAAWPPDLDLAGEPELVRELARSDTWLEQESIVLDPRLAEAIETMAETHSNLE